MDYEILKEVIAKKIKENGRGEITGPILQAVLMAMVDSLGEVYPQTYTDEQKAQARANIDALANYDGEITEEKLSAEVQAILDDVANKQNITDESLATIAKTIVGAINEVYKGGLEDASIATNKIEDGAVTTDKIADGAVTEPKLNDVLTAKVNNNVKTVEQILTDDEVNIASKNLKFRDKNRNIFLDAQSFEDFYDANVQNNLLCRSEYNAFTEAGDNSYNIIINSSDNSFGDDFSGNVCIGCDYNSFELARDCVFNQGFIKNGIYAQIYNCIFGTGCVENIINAGIHNCIFGNGVSFIELNSNGEGIPQNIHILSGVYGKSAAERLAISIPDEYLNSSRELIITTKRTDGGPSTPEDIVMYYADEVVDKQNKQDTTLETTSKEVVGAINELFNGGVKNNSITTEKLKDQAVEYAKLSASIRSTLDMIGMNAKVLPKGTDLKAVTEAGVYILSGTATYLNAPTKWEHYNAAILIVTGDNSSSYNQGRTIIGFQDGSRYPFAATLRSNEWTETDLDTALAGKLNNISYLTDTEINNIWDNN